MKKTFFTLAVIFTGFSAVAQFEKGTIMVGGSFGLSSNSNKVKSGSTTYTYAKSTSFSLQPQFGYFVADQLVLGAGLDVTLSTEKSENSRAKENTSSLQFQPFLRYYLPQGLYFQGQFGIGSYNYKRTNDNGNTVVETERNLSSWSLAAGYAVFLNDHVAIEPMLGYGSTVYKDPDNDTKWVDPGLFIRVGFQIYLRK